jgi:isochorismate hydrolase
LKETYFTPETLAAQAQRFLEEAQPRRRSHPRPLEIGRSALLALDLQRYFLEPESHACVPSAAAVLPGIQALAAGYAQRERPAYITRQLNTAENAGSMARWWREVLAAENPLSQLPPALETAGGERLVKSQYDAFYATDLHARLQAQGVSQVVICGVMTHLCCETTARSAFVLGYDVFFTVDGTATYNAAFHRAALLNLAHGFATLLLVGDVLAALQAPLG